MALISFFQITLVVRTASESSVCDGPWCVHMLEINEFDAFSKMFIRSRRDVGIVGMTTQNSRDI